MNRSEPDQFAEDDRSAVEIATKGGRRPSIEAGTAAVALGAGAFMLLDVFANITLPYDQSAFWPVILLTAAVAGGAYLTVNSQEKAWIRRHCQALQEIAAARRQAN